MYFHTYLRFLTNVVLRVWKMYDEFEPVHDLTQNCHSLSQDGMSLKKYSWHNSDGMSLKKHSWHNCLCIFILTCAFQRTLSQGFADGR
jgi:hypothetical protein